MRKKDMKMADIRVSKKEFEQITRGLVREGADVSVSGKEAQKIVSKARKDYPRQPEPQPTKSQAEANMEAYYASIQSKPSLGRESIKEEPKIYARGPRIEDVPEEVSQARVLKQSEQYFTENPSKIARTFTDKSTGRQYSVQNPNVAQLTEVKRTNKLQRADSYIRNVLNPEEDLPYQRLSTLDILGRTTRQIPAAAYGVARSTALLPYNIYQAGKQILTQPVETFTGLKSIATDSAVRSQLVSDISTSIQREPGLAAGSVIGTIVGPTIIGKGISKAIPATKNIVQSIKLNRPVAVTTESGLKKYVPAKNVIFEQVSIPGTNKIIYKAREISKVTGQAIPEEVTSYVPFETKLRVTPSKVTSKVTEGRPVELIKGSGIYQTGNEVSGLRPVYSKEGLYFQEIGQQGTPLTQYGLKTGETFFVKNLITGDVSKKVFGKDIKFFDNVLHVKENGKWYFADTYSVRPAKNIKNLLTPTIERKFGQTNLKIKNTIQGKSTNVASGSSNGGQTTITIQETDIGPIRVSELPIVKVTPKTEKIVSRQIAESIAKEIPKRPVSAIKPIVGTRLTRATQIATGVSLLDRAIRKTKAKPYQSISPIAAVKQRPAIKTIDSIIGKTKPAIIPDTKIDTNLKQDSAIKQIQKTTPKQKPIPGIPTSFITPISTIGGGSFFRTNIQKTPPTPPPIKIFKFGNGKIPVFKFGQLQSRIIINPIKNIFSRNVKKNIKKLI